MIIDTKKILTSTGAKLVRDIQDEFDSKGLNFTQEARNSLSFNATEKRLQIDGLMRIIVLNAGRKPGTFPPVEPIREWVRGKLNVDASEVNSVAFMIARKISQSGTDILTDKAKGLELDLLVDKLITQMHNEFSSQMNVAIGTEISNFMNQ